MSVSVTMPRLGESVTEGTVTRWLKKEGEKVEADEPLLEVSTDKVDTEIPAPASGVLSAIRVGEDETVEVGVELAVIDEGGTAAAPAQEPPAAEPEPEPAAEPEPEPEQPAAEASQPEPEPEPEPAPQPVAAQQAPPQQAPQQQAPPQQAPAQSAPQGSPQQPAAQQPAPHPPASGDGAQSDDSGAYVTPLVRKLAAEHDVDLGGIKGTGVGGRIRKQDVLEAARSKQPAEQAEPVGSSNGQAVAVTSPVSPVPGPASPAAVES